VCRPAPAPGRRLELGVHHGAWGGEEAAGSQQCGMIIIALTPPAVAVCVAGAVAGRPLICYYSYGL
jgi:hypothetical protein